MTRDDIITLAREAGALQVGFNKTIMQSEYSMFAHELERFAALVASAEREACADLCDELGDASNLASTGVASMKCAAAIRARSVL